MPERMRLHKAAIATATAVEIELRERVFRRYRAHVGERPALERTAREGLREHRSGKFCQFLVQDGDLTLGEMETVLKISNRAPEPIFRDFRGWLSRSQHRLTQRLDKLETFKEFRNPAVHEGRTGMDPK
jgi:hypothetical protein